jgi:hypothetical protein
MIAIATAATVTMTNDLRFSLSVLVGLTLSYCVAMLSANVPFPASIAEMLVRWLMLVLVSRMAYVVLGLVKSKKDDK